jgi:hypothetical protein
MFPLKGANPATPTSSFITIGRHFHRHRPRFLPHSESKARMSAQKIGNPKGAPFFCADKGRVCSPNCGKERRTDI